MTATATSKAVAGAILVAALALAGCGGGAAATAPTRSVPAGWTTLALPSRTASLAYPPGWRPIESDPGTVSAATIGRDGLIVGYLNATPRQANESLRNWATFRPRHNAQEGDRDVRVLHDTTGVPVGSGRGACVEDTYRTVRAHYHEVACLVDGQRASTVVVAAATTTAWPRMAGELRRAIAAFRT